MFHQFKVFRIQPEVFQDFRVVHVVGVISRDGEVTVAHHLLGDVDGEGAVDAGSVWLRHFLQRRGFRSQRTWEKKNGGKIWQQLNCFHPV